MNLVTLILSWLQVNYIDRTNHVWGERVHLTETWVGWYHLGKKEMKATQLS